MLKNASLRTKFVIVLVTLPTIALLIFLKIAVGTFESDKIAYIFESTSMYSNALAPQVRSEFARVQTLAATLTSAAQPDGSFNENGRSVFESEDNLRGFALFARAQATAKPLLRRMKAGEDAKSGVGANDEAMATLLAKTPAKSFPLFLGETKDESHFLQFAFLFKTEAGELVSVLALNPAILGQGFQDKGVMKAFLVTDGGAVLAPAASASGPLVKTLLSGPLKNAMSINASGVEQAEDTDGSKQLVSYADVGVGGMKVVSISDQRAAMSAVTQLVRKTSAIFLIMIAIIVVFSIFASKALTSALQYLTSATAKIASGDFAIQLNVTSKDEIGILAGGFNRMATEVARLLDETAVKARMSHELETARVVQESLLPKPHATLGSVQIAGFYEPASECGGDWWYYTEDPKFAYIWIGDATGHGVPAALFTSAARAAVAVIQQTPGMQPDACMEALNTALFRTGNGRMMMTFFLIRVEKETGEVLYSNASHELPFLVDGHQVNITKDDLVPMMGNNNPRLGEREFWKFEQSKHQLKPGDRIVVYTDGVYDFQNAEGTQLGQRRLNKILASSLSKGSSVDGALESTIGDFKAWRGPQSLDDDVTIIFVRYDGKKVGVSA